MSGLKIKTNKNYANLSFESAEGRTWIIQNWNNGNEFGVYHNDTGTFNFSTNAEGDLRVKRNGVFQGSVTASSFIGNADTASKWLTPRTLTIGGTGKSVDGSGNVSWSIDEIGCAYKYTDGFWRSLRDFTIGTLIQTSIDWVQSGHAWYLEIKGNTYGQGYPCHLTYQGYNYDGTQINHGGRANETAPSGLVMFRYKGKLCFWFPNQSYWQGFAVWVSTETSPNSQATNCVTSITNENKPSSRDNEITCDVVRYLDAVNFSEFAVAKSGDTMTGPLNIICQSNSPYDSTLYIGNSSSDDWGVKVDKGSSDYGLYIISSGVYGLLNSGGSVLKGKVVIGRDYAEDCIYTTNISGNMGFISDTGNLYFGKVNENQYHDITFYRGDNGNHLYICGNGSGDGGHIGVGTSAGTVNSIHVSHSSTDFSRTVKTNEHLVITQTDGGGYGLALYGGGVAPMTAYGIAFAQTSNFGTCGYLTADWATYFTMDGDVNRGWIFRHSGVNRASINGNGIISANGLYSHGIGYDGNIIMPQGGQFYTNNQYYYGFLRITLPVSWSDTMFRFDVNIYGYESTGMATYTIGCYNYAAHPSYHSTYAYCVGTGEVSRQPVYYGYDNGRCTIYIGEGSTRWAYPQVSITNVVTGYSSYSYGTWAYGWSVDFTTYNPNASVVIPCNNVNSNTDNYGSTNPLDYPTSILGYGKPGAIYYKV